jgi:hypothetical protein
MTIDLPLPNRKFLSQMLLGLLMAHSSLLSEIARRLKALRSITFHALHKSLCRNLKSTRWSVMPVQERYLQQAASKLGKDRLIAVDLGDITKTSACKMPQITTVRDGSTGELKKGWHLLEIEAMTQRQNRHIPLWLELFTIGKRRYQSVWTVIENAITLLVHHLGAAGIWVFDRGFDSWRFFAFLAQLGLTFLIRVNARRIVKDLSDGHRRSFGQIAQRVLHTAPMLWRRKFRGQALLLKVGFQTIEIPETAQRLSLIIIEGFGKHPLLLLTNRPLQSPQEAARWAKQYLRRWGVEEAGRLIKQVFDLENLRVLSWAGLVKLVWCALWTYGLVCLRRFLPKRRLDYLLSFYAGFGKIPDFPYYRLAGALSLLLLAVISTMPTLLTGVQKNG